MNTPYDFANICSQWHRTVMEEAAAAPGRMLHLPTLWERSQHVRKGISSSEVVYEEDRLKLLHYVSQDRPRYQTSLVFVYALVNRPYILDLKKGRSVVANFVQAGFDTYLVDWGIPTSADQHLTFEDYINGYLTNVLDFLRERTGAPKASVLGYSIAATMSAIFPALHPN